MATPTTKLNRMADIPTIPESARVTIERFGDGGLSDHEERQCDAAIRAATAEMRRRHDESMGAYRDEGCHFCAGRCGQDEMVKHG